MKQKEMKKLTYQKVQEIKAIHYKMHGYFPEYLHVHPIDVQSLKLEVVFDLKPYASEFDLCKLLGMQILIRKDIKCGDWFTS